MGSLSQPKNPLTINPGAVSELNAPAVSTMANRAQIQQLHGVNNSGSTGAGIPKQITGLQANISNAQVGTTSKVTVIFNRDSSDTAFQGVTIWVKGYQSNSSLVQVAQGVDSPITFVLTNTGESVTFVAQAFGNGGSAPIVSSPSVGLSLPKSSLGGVGTSTNVAITSVPASTTYPALGGDDFPFDFNIAPIATGLSLQLTGPLFGSAASWANSASTIARVDSTTQPTGTKFTTGTGVHVSAQCFYADSGGHNPPLAIYGRIRFRLSIGQTTNSRMFFGLTDSVNGLNSNASDNPNNNIIGFRYSSNAPDANWMMYCSTSNVAFTGKVASGSIDTGIHTFDVYYTSSSVSFYIDGSSVGSITTNIPASSTLMGPFINIANVSGGAVSFTSWAIKGVIAKGYR